MRNELVIFCNLKISSYINTRDVTTITFAR